MTSIVHKEMQSQNNKEFARGLLHTSGKLETARMWTPMIDPEEINSL